MVKVDKNLSYNQNYYGNVTNTRQFITIHETANTSIGAHAQAHANFINNGSQETWHYTVDDNHAIQHFYHTTACWHAGTYQGNTQSIGIEMCVNSDGNYLKTLENTIELVKMIMKQEGIPSSRVVQHNYWSGKNCPTLLRQGTHGMNWHEFISRVNGKQSSKKSKPKKVGDWHVNDYGTYYKKEKATFTVGNQPIETRIGSPFISAKSGGHVKPGQKINYDYVAIQDNHVWIQLTNNRGQLEFVPVRQVTGVPPHHKLGKLWGVIH